MPPPKLRTSRPARRNPAAAPHLLGRLALGLLLLLLPLLGRRQARLLVGAGLGGRHVGLLLAVPVQVLLRQGVVVVLETDRECARAAVKQPT